MLRHVLAASSVAVAVACASSGTSANWAAGYVVVTPRATAAFGLVRDSVPEAREADVPARVRRATASAARSRSFDEHCTRFFRADSIYVALLVASCDPDVTVDDGESLMALSSSGRLVGVGAPGLSVSEYTSLVPGRRPRTR